MTVVEELRAVGMARVARLPGGMVEEVNAYLTSRPVYADAHVPQTARNRGEGATARHLVPTSECLCVHNDDALLAPHLLELALSMTDVAAEYLGAEPVLYSANAFWTRPGAGAPRGDIQEFHRDADDSRFLAMFTYLTDVLSEADGPHQLIGPDGTTRTVLGPAGTVLLSDTSHEHRGLKPRTRERGVHWLRWGVSELPDAYTWDGLAPIPHSRLGSRYTGDPRLRRVLRPLVSPPPPP